MVALIPLKSSLDSNFYSSDRGKPSHLHETHNEFEGLSIEIEFLRVSEIWWRVVLPLTCQKYHMLSACLPSPFIAFLKLDKS
jgi:hypothetical protein